MLVPAPKVDIEPLAREYHSWGVTHRKMVVLLEENYDTEKYGLGHVLCCICGVLLMTFT
jgi:hypothetical protein